jgi:aryl-alcohol dehydrogenase-like predicted oxidoreductase
LTTTKLSPIVAGTMNWESGTNYLQEGHLMHICIENKITSFDHAPIFMAAILPDRIWKEHLRKAKSTENSVYF